MGSSPNPHWSMAVQEGALVMYITRNSSHPSHHGWMMDTYRVSETLDLLQTDTACLPKIFEHNTSVAVAALHLMCEVCISVKNNLYQITIVLVYKAVLY
jgi:hypothetical protein